MNDFLDTNSGKLTDVFIEDEYIYPDDPLLRRWIGLVVWADAGLEDTIATVSGVVQATTSLFAHTRYSVYLDPRYDREWVRREIEAVIKCKLDEMPAAPVRVEGGQSSSHLAAGRRAN